MKEAICSHCGKAFLKPTGEYNRKIRDGSRFFCSLKCNGLANSGHLKKFSGKIENLQPNNRLDVYSPYRSYLRAAKRRQKECGREVDITLDDLVAKWKDQKNGKCAYTGIQLQHPHYTTRNNPIYTASLDRIDSSKGYTRDNIQFVSIAVNYAKNEMTHEDTQEFFRTMIDANKSIQ